MSATQKFVVWDWNGTLLDDTGVVLAVVNIVLGKLNKAPITLRTLQECQACFHEHERPIEQFYRNVGLTDDEIPFIREHERNLFHEHYETLADKASLRDGAVNILNLLRAHGISNIIVSNHIADQIDRLLIRHGIRDYFGDIIAYADRHIHARDATKGDKLRHYIDEKGLNAANAIIIGDTKEEIDIARASGMGASGMGSIAITGGMYSQELLAGMHPDDVIFHLDELADIFRKRGFLS